MTAHRQKAGLRFLGLVLMLAGCGDQTPFDPAGRDQVREAGPAPLPAAYAAAGLSDALNRVIPELAGPGLPDLIAAVRDLADALETPGGDEVMHAAQSALQALVAFDAAGNRRYAADLDVVRLAIASTGILN